MRNGSNPTTTRLGGTLVFSWAFPDPAFPQGGCLRRTQAMLPAPRKAGEHPGSPIRSPALTFAKARVFREIVSVQDRGPYRRKTKKRPGSKHVLKLWPPGFSLWALLRHCSELRYFLRPEKLPWGKNLSRRAGCGIFRSAENFFAPGGAQQGIALAHPSHARTPKAGRVLVCQRRLFLLRFSHSSFAVLRLWQLWQRLRRFFLSVKSCQSPL